MGISKKLNSICSMNSPGYISFFDLKVYQKAKVLIVLIYKTSAQSTDWDLKNQLRRAAVSVMNNIVEGYTRRSKKETIRYLDISVGSAAEIIGMSEILADIEFCHPEIADEIKSKTIEIYKMTNSLLQHFNNKIKTKGLQL